jgi:hypothetical protein
LRLIGAIYGSDLITNLLSMAVKQIWRKSSS